MKVLFSPTNGSQRPCKVPFPGCDYVFARGVCPACGVSQAEESAFKLQGVPGTRTRGHDRYTAAARCVECQEVVGNIHAVFNTLFGLEEDEAVLHGRARVY